jgi:hypothetical protein
MHRSDRYLCILVGALCLVGTSVYCTRRLKHERDHDHAQTGFLVHVVASITLYATSLISLSLAAEEHARLQAKLADLRRRKGKGLRPFQYWPLELATWSTRVTGLLAGLFTFALPLVSPFEDPAVDVAIRIPTFFYSAKLLDLTVARARKPPVPRGAEGIEAYGLTSWAAHGANAWRLFSETRYASFDIAVDESARGAASGKRKDAAAAAAAWDLIPWLALPLAYSFPAFAEAQVVAGLLGVRLGLEGLHTLLHRRCPNPLFCRPFASAGFVEFWTCRWHQGAQPFLYNLGYAPARSVAAKLFGPDAGRAAGVLGAFSLSGFWHAWSGAALTRPEYALQVSGGLWFLFILQGLGCLVEKRCFRGDGWKLGWRGRVFTAMCWCFSIESASIWLRYSLPKTSMPGSLEIS